MTYDAQESSLTLGQPISLYLFRYGDAEDSFFAYTDHERSVTFTFDADIGPVTFEPIAISRTAANVSGSLDKSAITVRTPYDTAMAEMFLGPTPSQVVAATVWEGHVGKDYFVLSWSGRVVSHAGEGQDATFSCEPIATSLRRPGLTRNYQIHCPLVLYGSECGASREAGTIVRNPSAVDGPLVTLESDWEESDRKLKYAGGLLEWVGSDGRTQRRTIVKLNGTNQLVLSAAATGLTPAHAVSLSLGCNHDLVDCETLHDNVQNYGGQPFIPTANPFGIKNNFY